MSGFYKLKIDLPFFVNGAIYEFDDETGNVWRVTKEERLGPLRQNLSGYLWMLRTEPKYMKSVKPVVPWEA